MECPRPQRRLPSPVLPAIALVLAQAFLSCAASSSRPTAGPGGDAAGAAAEHVVGLGVNEAGDEQLVELESAPPRQVGLALRAYRQGQFETAAASFGDLLEASRDVEPRVAAMVEFFLAKALFHLELYQSSARIFGHIAISPSHPYHLRTLPWLAALDDHLEDRDDVVDLVGHYHPEDIGAGTARQTQDVDEHLQYLMGWVFRGRGAAGAASALFGRVPRSSRRWYLKARFLVGVTSVSAGEPMIALNAFHDVVDASEQPTVLPEDEVLRLRDLAWLNIARLHGSMGSTHRSGYQHAIEAYDHVQEGSEEYADALYELAWVHHSMGETETAARLLERLPAHYDLREPVVHELRALLSSESCHIDEAIAELSRFARTFLPIPDELDRFVGSLDDRALTDLVLDADGGSASSQVGRPALMVMRRGSSELGRIARGQRQIDEELERVVAWGRPLAGTSVAARIHAELAAAQESSRERLRRRADEIARELASEVRESTSHAQTLLEDLEERQSMQDNGCR